MVENLSENAVMCNFNSLNRLGFKFAEKNWHFGKYKINYFVFFGILLFNIKSWLTIFYKDDWSLTNFTFVLNIGVATFVYFMKFMLFLWNNKTIYKLTEMLMNDSIVIDQMDKRLEKQQKFCIKMAKSVFG